MSVDNSGQLPNRAPNYGLPLFKMAAKLAAEPPELPKLLIENMLHCGAKAMIGGSSKSMKTWNLIALAIAIATGVPWLGLICHRGPVLFVNLEVREGFFGRRLAAVASKMNVQLAKTIGLVSSKGAFHDAVARLVDAKTIVGAVGARNAVFYRRTDLEGGIVL
jgi:RecA-family ATPase